jgi:hypothetical protein
MERANELLKQSFEGKRKYDYFVVTISSAIFAYFGKDFSISKVNFGADSLILISLILLFLSIAIGLFKIQRSDVCIEKNGKLIDLQNKKNSYFGALHNNTPLVDQGKVKTVKQVAIGIKALDKVIPIHEKTIEYRYKLLKIYSIFRDVFFLLGLAIIALSKALPIFIQAT